MLTKKLEKDKKNNSNIVIGIANANRDITNNLNRIKPNVDRANNPSIDTDVDEEDKPGIRIANTQKINKLAIIIVDKDKMNKSDISKTNIDKTDNLGIRTKNVIRSNK